MSASDIFIYIYSILALSYLSIVYIYFPSASQPVMICSTFFCLAFIQDAKNLVPSFQWHRLPRVIISWFIITTRLEFCHVSQLFIYILSHHTSSAGILCRDCCFVNDGNSGIFHGACNGEQNRSVVWTMFFYYRISSTVPLMSSSVELQNSNKACYQLITYQTSPRLPCVANNSFNHTYFAVFEILNPPS